MAGLTLSSIVVFTAATLLYPYKHHESFVGARLSDLRTERLPILSHDLHTAHIGFDTLAERGKLGPRSNFRYKSGDFHKTFKGGKRVRLIQTYAGYEVYGPTAAAELDMRGLFTGQMYGLVARDLHRDIPKPEACVRDVNALIDRAIRLENLQRVNPEDIDKRDGRRVIFADPEDSKAKIVYVVEFFYSGESYLSSPVYYFEACSNAVIFHYDKVTNYTGLYRSPNKITDSPKQQESNDTKFNNDALKFKSERVGVACLPSAAGVGGNPKTGQFDYNTDGKCLPVTESGGICTMEGEYGKVIDNGNSESKSKSTVATFTCATGYSDPTNGAFGVANDALFWAEISGQFFVTRYSVKALKHKPRLVVHFKRDFANALWDGTSMYFGDGDDEFYPFTVFTMISHELAHGVTTSNSDLIYFFQMGGINEAFSDITSVATREYYDGQHVWTIGHELYQSGSKAIRYLNNPPLDGRSVKSIRKYHIFMNVHYSSGVFNYAFYRLIESEGVDMEDGYDGFYVANRDLWGRFTRFRKGACHVMQASYDSGHDQDKVKDAFAATDIKLSRCDYDALKATVFPGETRTDIMVKRTRSPIFEIDMRKWRGFGVTAQAVDSSKVRIAAATDGRVENLIAKGDNSILFPGNHTVVYVQLMSTSKKDVKVTMHVIANA